MTDNDTDGGEEPTFDLELPDATAEDLGLLLSSISLGMLHYAQRGGDEVADRCDALLGSLLVENPEAARHLFLDSEVSEYMVAARLPDETLDALEIELVNGEAYDARGEYEDIEVE